MKQSRSSGPAVALKVVHSTCAVNWDINARKGCSLSVTAGVFFLFMVAKPHALASLAGIPA